MGYMVLFSEDDQSHLGSGLSLAEAFARVLALAHCDYLFHRVRGVMYLELHHLDPVPESFDDPEAGDARKHLCESRQKDDAMARAEIMRKFVVAGFKGYRVVKDNYPLSEALSEPDLRALEHATARAG